VLNPNLLPLARALDRAERPPGRWAGPATAYLGSLIVRSAAAAGPLPAIGSLPGGVAAGQAGASDADGDGGAAEAFSPHSMQQQHAAQQHQQAQAQPQPGFVPAAPLAGGYW
jgi:hypothetical protein